MQIFNTAGVYQKTHLMLNIQFWTESLKTPNKNIRISDNGNAVAANLKDHYEWKNNIHSSAQYQKVKTKQLSQVLE